MMVVYAKKFVLIALFAGAVIAAGLFIGRSAEDEPVEEIVEQEIPVRVTPPLQRTLPRIISHSATIEPWEVAHITGGQGQIIERLHVAEGDRVRRGQTLVEMDDANLRQAQVELRMADQDLARTRRLVEIGAMASQQLEQASARHETAASNVELLQRNTRLTAPISGIVTDRYFVPGEVYVPGAQSPALLTIQQLDPLKVVVQIAERHYAHVRPGMTTEVTVDAYPGRTFEGEVARIHPTIRPESRTFRVEVRLDNADAELSAGMSARVHLNLGEVTGLFLPRSALQTHPGTDTNFVYLVVDGQARRTDLEVGPRFEQYQQILGGLDDDDQVVIEGISRLNEGTPVTVVDEQGER